MTRGGRIFAGLFVMALLTVTGVALIRGGLYGWTVFVTYPVLIGGVGAWMFPRETSGGWAGAGALTVLAASCLLFCAALEGAICILMTLPLSLPLGALGGLLAFRLTASEVPATGAALLLLLPGAGLGWDLNATPPVYPVHTAVEIAAPPETVWKHVVTFSELPEPREWFFRAGLAYPQRARIEGSGPGAVRYCEFSTGPFVEPIQVWDEPRLLQFRVTENPAPMHELSLYSQVVPKHLHGYLVSRKGQFQLTELSNHHTLLEGTTWYQHGLWPAPYWRLWSDAIIHRIHLRVLRHIRALSESQGAGG